MDESKGNEEEFERVMEDVSQKDFVGLHIENAKDCIEAGYKDMAKELLTDSIRDYEHQNLHTVHQLEELVKEKVKTLDVKPSFYFAHELVTAIAPNELKVTGQAIYLLEELISTLDKQIIKATYDIQYTENDITRLKNAYTELFSDTYRPANDIETLEAPIYCPCQRRQ